MKARELLGIIADICPVAGASAFGLIGLPIGPRSAQVNINLFQIAPGFLFYFIFTAPTVTVALYFIKNIRKYWGKNNHKRIALQGLYVLLLCRLFLVYFRNQLTYGLVFLAIVIYHLTCQTILLAVWDLNMMRLINLFLVT